MRRSTLNIWGFTLITAALLSGCHQPNDALVHQMQEMRKELADLRAKSAEDEKRTPEKKGSPYQALPTVQGPHHATSAYQRNAPTQRELPVVRLAPENRYQQSRWAPEAPVAKALQPKKKKPAKNAEKKRKNQDIALPPPEIPPMVFQTLDQFGQVQGQGPEQPAMPGPQLQSRIVDDHQEERVRDVSVIGPPTPIDAPELVAVEETATQRRWEATAPTPEPIQVAPALTPESHPMTLVSSAKVEVEPTPQLSGAELLYQSGMGALKAKQYGKAFASFQQLLDENPEDGLADNALYWLGEANYDQGKYKQALTLFQNVLRKYPLGNKVPDAMVKVGLCFQNLGKKAQARQILEQVMAIYPESNAAGVAASRLPTM